MRAGATASDSSNRSCAPKIASRASGKTTPSGTYALTSVVAALRRQSRRSPRRSSRRRARGCPGERKRLFSLKISARRSTSPMFGTAIRHPLLPADLLLHFLQQGGNRPWKRGAGWEWKLTDQPGPGARSRDAPLQRRASVASFCPPCLGREVKFLRTHQVADAAALVRVLRSATTCGRIRLKTVGSSQHDGASASSRRRCGPRPPPEHRTPNREKPLLRKRTACSTTSSLP